MMKQEQKSTRQYKIHVPYVNMNGSIVKEGTYDEGSFDLAEARYKSIVTMVGIDLQKKETKAEELPIQRFNDNSSELVPVVLEPEVKNEKIDFLKINSADESTIEALKYVSKKIAQDVVKEREKKFFQSYGDLNKRVPLKFNRVWEDITPIDFEEVVGHTTENSIYLSEGITPLN